jgi:hypothetical protein
MCSHFISPDFSCWWVAVRLTNNCRIVKGYQRTRGVAVNFSQTEQEAAVTEGTLRCDLQGESPRDSQQTGNHAHCLSKNRHALIDAGRNQLGSYGRQQPLNLRKPILVKKGVFCSSRK